MALPPSANLLMHHFIQSGVVSKLYATIDNQVTYASLVKWGFNFGLSAIIMIKKNCCILFVLALLLSFVSNCLVIVYMLLSINLMLLSHTSSLKKTQQFPIERRLIRIAIFSYLVNGFSLSFSSIGSLS